MESKKSFECGMKAMNPSSELLKPVEDAGVAKQTRLIAIPMTPIIIQLTKEKND